VFDATLSLGPFYHLPDPGRREQAARELARVLRPGGVAFVAFMPRLTLLGRTIAIADERGHLEDEAWLRALLERGEFTNDVPGRFNGGYGVSPEDVAPFMESFGFETLSLSAAESMVRGLQEAIAEIAADDGGLHSRVVDLLEQVAEEPSILGLASHLLYVGRRT
jgi:SAM-dependent methyltransferase